MKAIKIFLGFLIFRSLCFFGPVMASQWQINEIFSNPDGSIQYIELYTAEDNQHLIKGNILTTMDSAGVEGKSFTIPENLTSETAGKFLLFATEGFENLNAGTSADYIVENNFLFADGGLINFNNEDEFSYEARQLPKNGLQSLGHDWSVAAPSPVNFNGDTGSFQLSVNPDYDINTKLLRIPALSLANSNAVFNAVLSLNNSDTLELAVVDYYAYQDDVQVTTNSPTFDGSLLNLIDLEVGEELFQLQMSLINDNPITFGNLVVNPDSSANQPSCDIEDIVVNERAFKVSRGWAVPSDEVFDGGPGQDGIPSIDRPEFIPAGGASSLSSDELVVGVKVGDDIRAYPHNILNWHEIVNDRLGQDEQRVIVSYCPLTGSALLWKAFSDSANKTFGVSGLLYNSNLILYDRQTGSRWSQMYEVGIKGSEILTIPDKMQLLETTWGTWKTMYPNTLVLSEDTGFSRNYDFYPYGSYRTNNSLIFPAENSNDSRLHKKERVLGINVGTSSKVYVLDEFTNGVEVVNDTVTGLPVVAALSAGYNFGVIYKRPVSLRNCEYLEFTPVQGKLPIVMEDNEGNQWDIFGAAVSGERIGQQLEKTESYIAYWFAWISFFDGAQIYNR